MSSNVLVHTIFHFISFKLYCLNFIDCMTKENKRKHTHDDTFQHSVANILFLKKMQYPYRICSMVAELQVLSQC